MIYLGIFIWVVAIFYIRYKVFALKKGKENLVITWYIDKEK